MKIIVARFRRLLRVNVAGGAATAIVDTAGVRAEEDKALQPQVIVEDLWL